MSASKLTVFRPQFVLLELALLAVLVLGGLYAVSLFSFHPDDPGLTTSGSGTEVANQVGLVGAYIADLSRFLFGLGAHALMPVLLPVLARIFIRARREQPWLDLTFVTQLGGALLLFLSVVVLMAINHPPLEHPQGASAGGVVGQVLAISLVGWLGVLGSTLVVLALAMLGVTAVTGLSWLALFGLIGAAVLAVYNRLLILVDRVLIDRSGKLDERLEPSIAREQGVEFQGDDYISADTQDNKTSTAQSSKPEKSTKQDDEPSKSSGLIARVTAKKQTNKTKPTKASNAQALDGQIVDSRPVLDLLDPEDTNQTSGFEHADLDHMSEVIEARLQEFGVSVSVVAAHPGPVITRFELQPAPGVKVSQISNLSKDLARALSIISVRVVEVIPGKSTVGLEIPNTQREIIALRSLLESDAYRKLDSPLTLTLGKDIGGEPVVADLAKMPHLLVAGTTGSGKSVGVNAMIISLLYKARPDEVKLILIDPKMLELSVYEGIGHLLAPVVTDMKDAANALRWAVGEMERRYQLMAALGVRNIKGANEKIQQAIDNDEPIVDPLFKPEEQLDPEQAPPTLEPFPYLVIVVDEFADMMMVVGKKVEELIARLAQKARAAGIHLILATQRPSVDVITGLIKANIPTRIAFQVSSKVDSRTILDQMGAEHLLGHGDMLYLPPGSGMPKRVHGAFVSDDEVHRVVEALKTLGKPEYIDAVLSEETAANVTLPGEKPVRADGEEIDELYDQAVAIVTESRKASISYVQRRLKIGYNRSARILEQMEEDGVVSTATPTGGREVLAPPPPK